VVYNVFTGDDMPILAVLSTVGVKNSFDDINHFLTIPLVLRNTLINEGLFKAKMKLTAFLTKAANEGSGDDVTISTIFQKDIIKSNNEQNATKQSPES
jgi:hypothetical protein